MRVTHGGVLIAETRASWRILETSHAPAYYIPASDVRTEFVSPSRTRTVCEYKGVATYGTLTVPGSPTVSDACWWYAAPTSGYESIRDAICFYPQRVDRCEVDGEIVVPLASSFYGDWPTSWIDGPYKGAPGTEGW